MFVVDPLWHLLYLLDFFEVDDRILCLFVLRLVDGDCEAGKRKGAYMAV